MKSETQSATAGDGRRGLWPYNIRILIGNTYWLVVTPIVTAQLVIFWNMATSSLFSPTRAAQTIELLAPILGAFLCAHALAPEQDGVGELVFARPLSFEKVLLLRLAVICGFVLAVLAPASIIYQVGIPNFPLGLALLAGLASMLFLSVLAMAVASGTRHPLLGLGAAGLFWALDGTVGGYFNPLVSLHSFADHLADQPMSEQWVVNKLVLIGLAALLYLWTRQILGRPASPRRWRTMAVAGLLVIVFLAGYVTSGAAYKVGYGIRHERELGPRTLLWYQRQFRGYGPIPVAWMFGPAFPLYVQADLGRTQALAGRGTSTLWAPVDIPRMKLLLDRYPESIWADNAQFEIASEAARQRAPIPWLVLTYQHGKPEPERKVIQENLSLAAQEMQKLVDRYPDSPFAALALSRKALIGLALLDFETAAASYQRLLRDYPESPQAHDAGLELSALHLRAGRPEDALQAADTASNVAPWDIQAEALLAAARAAQEAGNREAARSRYERARSAAQRAIERALGQEPRPTRLPKDEFMRRADAVVSACNEALSGSLTPSSVHPAAAEVTGRLLRDGRGAAAIRVALGASPGSDGSPSPFLQGPAASSTTDAQGVFRLQSVTRGEYRVAAFAIPTPGGDRNWAVEGLPLPIRVEQSPVVIPPLILHYAWPGRAMRPPTIRGNSPGLGSPPGGERSRGGRSRRAGRHRGPQRGGRPGAG